MIKTEIHIKKFPGEFYPTQMKSCNDPKNYTAFTEHDGHLNGEGWCPCCGETTILQIKPGDYWTLGVADDGELVVALKGPGGATLHVFNYERYSYEEPRRLT